MTRLEELISKGPVEWRTLGEVADVTIRVIPDFAKYYSDTGTIIALHALNVRGWLDLSQVKYLDGSNLGTLARNKLRRNDLVLTRVGCNVGQVALVDCDDRYYMGPNLCRVRFTADVEPRFALHCFQTKAFYSLNFRHHVRKSTMKNLNAGGVRCFMIPLPPLAVQQEIADVLDMFSELEVALKAELEARRKQYEYYQKQLLTFGDEVEWRTLGEVADITGGVGKEFTRHYSDTGTIIALRALNVKGRLDLSRVKYIDGSSLDGVSRCKLFRNDLLLTHVGSVGQVALVDYDDRYYLGPNVCRIRFAEGVDPRFALHYFQTEGFFSLNVRQKIRRSTMEHFNTGSIRKFWIPTPPLDRQREIADVLDAFSELEFALKAELGARRKQYAYYRERLMGFPRPEGGTRG